MKNVHASHVNGAARVHANPAAAVESAQLERLRNLHKTHLRFGDARYPMPNEIVEALKELAELLIWGDANNADSLFDYFCEEGILEYMATILPKMPKTVKVQLLQTISMLVHNLSNKKMLYYILSNNHINTLLSTSEMYTEDDVASWMVALLKTLSSLLDPSTIKFFYQETWDNFPLLDRAIKFLASKDTVKRAHVMTILHNILKVGDGPVLKYMVSEHKGLSLLPLYLRQHWRHLNQHVKTSPITKVGRVQQDLLSSIEDLYCFIQELMDINMPQVHDLLYKSLFTNCFFPLITHILKGGNYKVDNLEELTAGADAGSNTTAETLWRLHFSNCLETGLVALYNMNKQALVGSEPSVLPSLESPNSSNVPSPVPSEPPTPRALVEFATPPTLTQGFSVTIAYFLLTFSTSAARHPRVRETLLLLLFCPRIPKVVLEHFFRGYTRETLSSVFEALDNHAKNILYGGPLVNSQVLNFIANRIISLALENLPRDNCWGMLASCLSNVALHCKTVGHTGEFYKFLLVPGGTMHLWAQLFNSLMRHMSNVELRMPIVHIGICNAISLAKEYGHIETFRKELTTHVVGAMATLERMVIGHFDKDPLEFLSIFYDEWMHVESHIEFGSLLHCPQLLYNLSCFDIVADLPQDNKQPVSFWFYKPPTGSTPTSTRTSARLEVVNRDWAIPIKGDVFRRNVQAVWMLYRLKRELFKTSEYPSLTPVNPNQCPMLLGKANSIVNSEPCLYLGSEFKSSLVKHFPCVVEIKNEVKIRHLLVHPLLFLLGRENASQGTFEVTSIHPLWNTSITQVNSDQRFFILKIKWHPKKADNTLLFSAAPTPLNVSEFKITLENVEHLTEYTTLYKLHLSNMVTDCMESLNTHVFQREY